MLVPAVFAVLMKMNLYLWDRIIHQWHSADIAARRQLADTKGCPQAGENNWLLASASPDSRGRMMHVDSATRADDFFSEMFPVRSHSQNGR